MIQENIANTKPFGFETEKERAKFLAVVLFLLIFIVLYLTQSPRFQTKPESGFLLAVRNNPVKTIVVTTLVTFLLSTLFYFISWLFYNYYLVQRIAFFQKCLQENYYDGDIMYTQKLKAYATDKSKGSFKKIHSLKSLDALSTANVIVIVRTFTPYVEKVWGPLCKMEQQVSVKSLEKLYKDPAKTTYFGKTLSKKISHQEYYTIYRHST